MGKMISTTEELAALFAEVDCANTEPADAASKGRRVRCAMVIRFPECCKLCKAAGASIPVDFTRRMSERLKRIANIFFVIDGWRWADSLFNGLDGPPANGDPLIISVMFADEA